MQITGAESDIADKIMSDSGVINFIFMQDGDPILQPDPSAAIPKPSVVYDNSYEAANNNGREYDWWAVT